MTSIKPMYYQNTHVEQNGKEKGVITSLVDYKNKTETFSIDGESFIDSLINSRKDILDETLLMYDAKGTSNIDLYIQEDKLTIIPIIQPNQNIWVNHGFINTICFMGQHLASSKNLEKKLDSKLDVTYKNYYEKKPHKKFIDIAKPAMDEFYEYIEIMFENEPKLAGAHLILNDFAREAKEYKFFKYDPKILKK